MNRLISAQKAGNPKQPEKISLAFGFWLFRLIYYGQSFYSVHWLIKRRTTWRDEYSVIIATKNNVVELYTRKTTISVIRFCNTRQLFLMVLIALLFCLTEFLISEVVMASEITWWIIFLWTCLQFIFATCRRTPPPAKTCFWNWR